MRFVCCAKNCWRHLEFKEMRVPIEEWETKDSEFKLAVVRTSEAGSRWATQWLTSLRGLPWFGIANKPWLEQVGLLHESPSLFACATRSIHAGTFSSASSRYHQIHAATFSCLTSPPLLFSLVIATSMAPTTSRQHRQPLRSRLPVAPLLQPSVVAYAAIVNFMLH
ncbi:hypothetical protein U1Q18_035242 [Sarracenia purpurea var. burkii]